LKKTIPFLKYRYYALALSFALLVFFVTVIVIRGGMPMGVDFVGGVKIIARFESGANESKIRKTLSSHAPEVQQVGQKEKNEFIISVKLSEKMTADQQGKAVTGLLQKDFKDVQVMSIESVGPAVGSYLRRSAIKLSIIAILLMSAYLAYRFEAKYAAGCMVALIHDVILTAAYSGFANIDFNVTIVAALLTIFGFSVNDTIVVFDRVRENIAFKTKQTLDEIINRSVTETLSRTILTSLTVFFSVLCLYLLGGEGISDFAQVMLFGLFCGTYSTVFIASPVVVIWERIAAK
jgi:preprotein translocase subunit SecF